MAYVIKQIGNLRKIRYTEEEQKLMDSGAETDFEYFCYWCRKPIDDCDCGLIHNVRKRRAVCRERGLSKSLI